MESNYFFLDVNPILSDTKPGNSAPRKTPMTLHFLISYETKHLAVYQSHDGNEALLGSSNNDRRASVSFSSSITLFKDKDAVHEYFYPRLSSMGIGQRFHERLVTKIIQDFRQLLYWVSKKREVLPLRVKIVREHRVYYDERYFTERALRESRLQLESRGNIHGMVPADTNRLRLKCVKLKGETEDCSICLEGLSEFAASMPCNHMFHPLCIVKWLRESHYCPVCRFEMPTKA